MMMMHIIITFIGILPPYIEIFKVLDPYLGMTFETLRLAESRRERSIRARAGFFNDIAMVFGDDEMQVAQC